MSITNIDKYKEVALERLNNLIEEVKSGEVVGIAVCTTYKDGDSGNMWVSIGERKSVLLIGELHCLMSDLEYYEIQLRKDKEIQ